MKRNLIWLAASVAAMGAGVTSAQYSTSPGYGDNNAYGQTRTVRCESIGSRQALCRIDGADEVRIVRQLSRQACVRGRNWDYDDRSIRVTDGCRADFQVLDRNQGRDGYGNDGRYGNGRGQTLHCESRSSRRRTFCGNIPGPYAIAGYRNANCIEGRNWGQAQRGVWVSGRCSADFQRMRNDNGRNRGWDNDRRQDASYDTLRCESANNGRTYCGDARSQYSIRDSRNANCIQGRTWGTDERGLWVSGYCRAEFDRRPYGEPRNDTFPNGTYNPASSN